jgi:hypothetical protein
MLIYKKIIILKITMLMTVAIKNPKVFKIKWKLKINNDTNHYKNNIKYNYIEKLNFIKHLKSKIFTYTQKILT